jgi:hypothetical protein
MKPNPTPNLQEGKRPMNLPIPFNAKCIQKKGTKNTPIM